MTVRLNERFPVTDAKERDLRQRIAQLGLDLEEVEESFVRGGGKGGQKVNKSANCVLLRHAPSGLVIRCHRERSRSLNRFLALRELVDRLELRISPGSSRREKAFQEIRRRKARRARRAALGRLHKEDPS